MIKTNELMLGNWVEYATGLNGDNRSIPMKVVALFGDCAYLDFDGNPGDVWEEEWKNLLGIPITEELLEKCGFHYSEVRDIETCGTPYRNRNVLAFLADGNVVLYTDETKHNITDIHFLHELQNAYFMLTKKHLEVKL